MDGVCCPVAGVQSCKALCVVILMEVHRGKIVCFTSPVGCQLLILLMPLIAALNSRRMKISAIDNSIVSSRQD